MIISGIGCRRGTAAETILAALEQACAAASLGHGRIGALATGFIKAEEPGLRQAATMLHLPLIICTAKELSDVESHLFTESVKSRAVTGSGSLSEAAALAAAGVGGRLVLPRFVIEGVTIAFATGDIP